MSYTVIKKLTPIQSILQAMPLSDECFAKISSDRREIKRILSGDDNRLLIIVGPCSAWPSEAVIHYAEKLQRLNESFADVLKIVMRVYIEKPRTTKGWSGPVNQPDPLSEPDVEKGIRYVRQMMVDVINIGLPIADEALFTHNSKGFIELLSWVAIGARSSEDQEHRIFASSLDCAVGLKNPTAGSIAIGVNSVVAAQHAHVAVFDGHVVQTHGNPFAHLVLRGSQHTPNYGKTFLNEARLFMQQHNIQHPAVIIDASHDNCIYDGKKDHQRQSQVILETLDNMQSDAKIRSLVKGFMIESFIKDGCQKLNPDSPETLDLSGLSITDPCLSFETTENLLFTIANRLRTC